MAKNYYELPEKIRNAIMKLENLAADAQRMESELIKAQDSVANARQELAEILHGQAQQGA